MSPFTAILEPEIKQNQITFSEKQKPALKGPVNILSIDVEDWFHVSNFSKYLSKRDWETCAWRIPYSMPRLLDLLQAHNARATFFTLGWVAERFPRIIRRIHEEGHEIASHGQDHQLVTLQSPEEFREQLIESRDTLEQIIGEPVYGHRAPSYSLGRHTKWAVEILLESGFKYDSSVFPFGFRKDPEWCDARFPCWIQYQGLGQLAEYPLTTYRLFGKNIPVAGGGYFRFFPYPFVKWALQDLNKQGHVAHFYLHPWELDPEQPRVHKASWLERFRHYHQLEKTESKLESLLRDFKFYSIRDIYWSESSKRYEIEPQN